MGRIFLLFLFLFPLSVRATQAAAAATCVDASKYKIYQSCSDQKLIYIEAAARAINEKKLLIVTIGANWCPSCQSADQFFTDSNISAALAPKFIRVDIADSYLDSTRHLQKVSSGGEVLASLEAIEPFTDYEKRGIPIIAVVDPVSLKHIAISIADINAGVETQTVEGATAPFTAAYDKMMERIKSGEAKGLIP